MKLISGKIFAALDMPLLPNVSRRNGEISLISETRVSVTAISIGAF